MLWALAGRVGSLHGGLQDGRHNTCLRAEQLKDIMTELHFRVPRGVLQVGFHMIQWQLVLYILRGRQTRHPSPPSHPLSRSGCPSVGRSLIRPPTSPARTPSSSFGSFLRPLLLGGNGFTLRLWLHGGFILCSFPHSSVGGQYKRFSSRPIVS